LRNYVASGLTNSSRQVLTETLHSLELKWVRRVALAEATTASIQNSFATVHHIAGRAGQETGYYVDMPGVMATNFQAFNGAVFITSAMEHGVIEQSGATAAVSTIRCLALANDGGQKIFKATSSNYAGTVGPQLANYSPGQLSSFSNSVASGYTLLVHQNGQTSLNQWTGFGYAALSNSIAQMLIGGGYSGGWNSNTGTLEGEETVDLSKYVSAQYLSPNNVGTPASAEPVDLLTGAYTMAHADLTLGEQASPRGLNFTRYYDGLHNFEATTLGNGWRHSCEGSIVFSSELDNAFGFIQPTDAAQTIVGLLAVCDFSSAASSPQELLVGALTANWTVNRITNNAANVQFGNERVTYISQPDGSWNPPPGSTTNLVGASGSFTLQPRFGGSVSFDSQNRISQWTDVDGNAQTYSYDGSGHLTTVTDHFGRTLTFTYFTSGAGNGYLKSVQDSTGRSVQFNYTAGTYSGPNLTGITDPENYQTTLVYDSRNRITDWLDNAGQGVTHNDYDPFDRVWQQLSQGLASHAWVFRYSPGMTLQLDPQTQKTAQLFDYKNRDSGVIDPLGHQSSKSYDSQNHVVSAVDATGRQTSALYDSNQNLSQSTDAAGKITVYQYDGSMRLWRMTDATSRTTQFGYDGKNHLTSVQDPGGRTMQYVYRSDGLLDHSTDPANKTTSYTAYDGYGNPTAITRADGTTTSATYFATGDLKTFTDGRGYTTQFTYDNRRLKKTQTDARSQKTQWAYDSNGYLSSITDRNGHTVATTYDNLGHLKTTQAQDTATVTSNYDSRDWSTGFTDGLGHSTTYGYDSAGRRTSITNALSVATTQWTKGRPSQRDAVFL
jgi:YD repeat-containing protein